MTTSREGWQKVKIGQIGRVVTGKTPPTKRQELYGGECPFITPTDISEGRYKAQPVRFLSEKGHQYQRRYLLPKDTVCYTCIASIGKICITTEPSFTNQQINSIVVDFSKFDYRFIYHLLRYETERIRALASGAAAPIINKSAFSDIELLGPPLLIQRKIAAILSAYDDLIENNTRRIAILEEMAQALYREWFVHFRFPGHEQVAMVDSELGLIPEGWEMKRLGDVCNIVMGQSPRSEFYNEKGEGLPFHQGVKDFGDIFPTTRVHCTVTNRIAEEDDILFSVRAPVGRMNIADRRLVIGRGLCAIRSKTGNQAFVFHQLKDKFREEDMIGGGTIFKAVTKADMHGIEILMAPTPLIAEFEQIANPMFDELRILTTKNANLRRTRDLLLPRLISGEVDVSELPIDVGGLDR